MKNNSDKNNYMLHGLLGWKGYDCWWHSFTGINAKTGEEKAFFIEYLVMNPRSGSINPVFGDSGAEETTPSSPWKRFLSKGNKPSYVMVKAGVWGKHAKQLHRFFGAQEFECAEDDFRVVVGDCFLSDTVLKGNITVTEDTVLKHPEYRSDSGSMSWLLQVDKQGPFDVGYGSSKLLRELNAVQMYWHVSGMQTKYSGTIHLDGERYLVRPESSYGYADKNWGSDFINPFLWLASNKLKSRITGEVLTNTAFDIGGGCPKVFSIPLKETLLGLMYYKGKEYEFNFSKFWTFAQTKFRCKETDSEIFWQVRMANASGAIEIKASCLKSEMLNLRYQTPDGSHPHKTLWSGGTGHAQVKLFKRTFGVLRLVDDMYADHMGCQWSDSQKDSIE